jgi:hypothetical protein
MSSAAPRDATAFEVRDALGASGCVVCRLALRSVARLLQSVAYEQVNDINLRARLRKRRGFCTLHAHQWLRESHNVLGTAIIYKDVLEAALRDLDSPSANGQRSRLLRGLLGPSSAEPSDASPCPACQTQAEAEARYLEVLQTLLATDAACVAQFDASDGLCRQHTLNAVRSGRPGVEPLLARARQIVVELVEQLDEVIRKEDYRFRHEARSDAERTAPARATAWAAGLDGLTST